MLYNWQQADWPQFRFDRSQLEPLLVTFVEQSGRMSGLLQGLNQEAEEEIIIGLMIEEAMKSSSIEGEFLSRQDLMSSIKNHLGIASPVEQISDLRAAGMGELMTKIRRDFHKTLDEETLFDWHRTLMKGSQGIVPGKWRVGSEPMRVVSGRLDQPTIHFEAPPSQEVPAEMTRFFKWFNQSFFESKSPLSESPLRAGIAHLYFESIHPFEDGNGRIGRAISEKALAQGAGHFAVLSLSQVIENKRNEYYDKLKSGQRDQEITDWLRYFLETTLQAQAITETEILFSLKKTRFFDKHGQELNPRQRKVVERILEAGPDGFQGGMNTRKYLALTKTSKATATRDLQELVQLGILKPLGKARATRYELEI